ncbi:serine/threonine dehydratase [Marinicella rhabdoformis]|uniref:serine/threonine dehydratase n=1 Tax=Marinicella rhabdoformis TaxID=2580566 RepID=UPI0012AEB65A|nr:serine/threonine dehydratase [Marinicella rhabdoformis]
MLKLTDIQRAAERITPYINKTPVVTSSLLNQWLGHEVYFKAECFQKVGAFKARGGCNAVQKLMEAHGEVKRVVANSSGNHAQAVAWSARTFGIDATIYMPSFASQVKAQATRAYGAEVVLADTRQEVDQLVSEAAEEPGTFWIPPFNDEAVMAGQGTAALEAWSQMKDEPNAVFAPCGGGGLLSGTLAAVRGLSATCQVVGAEPLNGNDAAESIRAGAIQVLGSSPDTLADGAMTLSVGDKTFEHLMALDAFYEVDEHDIAYWTQWLQHVLKLHVEPTSAMTMGAVCQWLKNKQKRQKVLVILSGGNIDESHMRKVWADDHLANPPRL